VRWFSRQRSLRAQLQREKACDACGQPSPRVAETREPAAVRAAKRHTASGRL